MTSLGLTAAFWILELAAQGAGPRRIAIRASSDLLAAPEVARLSGWGHRMGVEIEVAEEDRAVSAGWESLRLSTLPCSVALRRRLAAFPLGFERHGFAFDGRSYSGPDDAIALTAPTAHAETIVVGNSPRAVLRLAAARFFWEEGRPADYEIASGDLTKRGRFLSGSSLLAIDRAADRDEIAAQADFLRAQKTETRQSVRWRFRESERSGIERWEPVLKRFVAPGGSPSLVVRLFPDAVSKARATGSTRPADVSRDGTDVVVDIDLSAPTRPDRVSPVLAAGALAAAEKRLLARPMLLLAAGARVSGRWYGRDIASYGAFCDRAGVLPAAADIVKGDENLSPVLAVGAAASWLEAGARAKGERAVSSALLAADAECTRALSAWSALASRVSVRPSARRPLPRGFLRGLSYAMTNTISGSYCSPRSRETLAALSAMSVDSISVMPFAFEPDPARPEIHFVHRHPAGETDEGTVKAVSDAHALGMSALVKPQIWLGGGQFVGQITMRDEKQWSDWFAAYRRFLVHHAVVAEAAGADLFCVGTELVGTENRSKEWHEAIAAARWATGAPLTYAANWASGAPRVPFWDALDVIGVDFYDPLSTESSASDGALTDGVRRAGTILENLSRQTGKPVIFAEAGYPPVRSAWTAPHDEGSDRPSAPGDAARAIAAVFRGLEKEAWWKGVYWWKVFSDGRAARAGERGYNILGTPAGQTIAEAFARLARERVHP